MPQTPPTGVQLRNQGSDYRNTPGLYVPESGGIQDKAVAYSELAAAQAAINQTIAPLESAILTQGDRLDDLAARSGVKKIPFGYGDATPKPIAFLDAGTVVFSAAIVIISPFNGNGSALKLGDAGVSDRLIEVSQNDPLTVAEYGTNPSQSYLTATQIILTITPGSGCTQGSGFILIEV